MADNSHDTRSSAEGHATRDAADVDETAIARQAILDAQGAVFGYELFNRAQPANGHNAATDAQLLFNVLSHADHGALVDSRTMFLNCTHDSLAGGHLELVKPDRLVLEIPPVPGHGVDDVEARLPMLQDLRKRGFALAFNHTVLTAPYAPWLPLASYIKLDLSRLRADQLGPAVQAATARSPARLVAEKVETAEQHAMAVDLGITLFQGYWFAKPVLVRGQTIRPAQAVIIQLINLVRKQASTAEIEDVLKRDPTLSFNLLRFINSSGFGLGTEITSFRHAVMLLGLKKLFRWAALLLTTSRVGGLSPAVGTTAIVRGRLMEMLVEELKLGPEECDNAFVTGVFSLLDTMLGVPMDKALESISLPETVISALLLRRGALAPYLALAEACEGGDEETFAQLADALHLSSRQINMAHLQALGWADMLQT